MGQPGRRARRETVTIDTVVGSGQNVNAESAEIQTVETADLWSFSLRPWRFLGELCVKNL